MFANALQVPLRAVKIHPLPFNTIPPKRQLSIKLLLASQAYETPAVIAAFLTEKQNTSDATGNCCSSLYTTQRETVLRRMRWNTVYFAVCCRWGTTF